MDGGSGSSLGVISQKCEEMKPRRLQLFPSFWSSREDDAKAKDNICGEAAWGGEEATLSERQRRSRQVGGSWRRLYETSQHGRHQFNAGREWAGANFALESIKVETDNVRVCLSGITSTFPLKAILNHSGRMLDLIYYILLARGRCEVMPGDPRWSQVVPCGVVC